MAQFWAANFWAPNFWASGFWAGSATAATGGGGKRPRRRFIFDVETRRMRAAPMAPDAPPEREPWQQASEELEPVIRRSIPVDRDLELQIIGKIGSMSQVIKASRNAQLQRKVRDWAERQEVEELVQTLLNEGVL